MDILRNLFGTLTSGIIRLAVTVGILAAVYFFLVKPVLKTTDKAINGANKSLEQSLGTESADVVKTVEEVNKQIQRQIERSFHTAQRDGNQQKLVRCIRRSKGNVKRIELCTKKF